MYLNNINFPNEIIDAIKEKKLVVFAGAGASMGKPTCLPDFNKLARDVAYGTGETLDTEKESAEVFLGKLKYRGIDVNERAAGQLSKACLQPNDMHRAIIDLFSDEKNIKIVTTNYDHMFEAVLQERDSEGHCSLPIYDVPAIPLGNDVNGIIHLHGNISNPKYMVLTDEDFGEAYLTEGYASRFLVQLFNEYTILFIGYSYNDIILRYLTRAMSRNKSQKKYIMTYENEDAWEALGINAIKFPPRDYEAEKTGLQELGRRIKKGLLDWKYQFSAVALSPHKDLTSDSEIDYCLSKYETAKIIADCVRGKEWLECLDDKGVFDNLFNRKKELSDKDRLWADWLIKWFLTDEEEVIINLYNKKNNDINDEFTKMIIRELSLLNQDISPELFSKYIFLFGNIIDDHYWLLRLAELCAEKGWNDILFKFFVQMFNFSFVTKKSFWRDGFELNHVFCGEYYSIERIWKENREIFLEKYAYELMTAVQRVIKDIVYAYKSMGANEPWGMINLSVEDKKSRALEEYSYIFCDIIEECGQKVGENDAKAMRLFIIDSLDSDSILLKRLALKILRDSNVIKESEKIEIAFKRVSFALVEAREQIQKLIKKAYASTRERGKKVLYKQLDNYTSEKGDEEYIHRQKYNWYAWLQKLDKKNTVIQEKIEKILSKYPDFEPYIDFEGPYFGGVRDIECDDDDKSPKSEDELLAMSAADVVSLLDTYEEDFFKRPKRYKLLETIISTCKRDYEWSKCLVKYLLSVKNVKEDIWPHVFRGLEAADFSIDENMCMISILLRDISKFEKKTEIAEYLWKIINMEGFKEYYRLHKNQIFGDLHCVWNNRENAAIIGDSIYMYCLNSTLGILLKCYVLLLQFDSDDGISDAFKKRFEECLGFVGDEHRVSVCILAGYYMLLSYRDKEWCFNKIIPYLESSDEVEFSDAWGGVVYLSRRMNIDRVKELEGTYLKAIKQIKKLPKETKDEFVDICTTIIVSVVEDPIEKYIPTFLKYSDVEARRKFAFEINHRLMNMSDENKKNIWNKWLRTYLVNRNGGIPTKLTNDDRLEILEWLVELEPVFEEAVDVVCEGEPPKKIDGRFLYSFEDKKLARSHPDATVKLLIHILKDKTSLAYSEPCVRKIYEDLPKKLQDNQQLKESLLRCGISDN